MQATTRRTTTVYALLGTAETNDPASALSTSTAGLSTSISTALTAILSNISNSVGNITVGLTAGVYTLTQSGCHGAITHDLGALHPNYSFVVSGQSVTRTCTAACGSIQHLNGNISTDGSVISWDDGTVHSRVTTLAPSSRRSVGNTYAPTDALPSGEYAMLNRRSHGNRISAGRDAVALGASNGYTRMHSEAYSPLNVLAVEDNFDQRRSGNSCCISVLVHRARSACCLTVLHMLAHCASYHALAYMCDCLFNCSSYQSSNSTNRCTNPISNRCTNPISDRCTNRISNRCTNPISDRCTNPISNRCTIVSVQQLE